MIRDDIIGNGRLDLLQRIAQYRIYAINMSSAHFKSAENLKSRGLMLGILAAVFAAIAGSTALSSLVNKDPAVNSAVVAMITGMLALFSAGLTVVNTFLQLEVRAKDHKQVALLYESARREADEIQLWAQPDQPWEQMLERFTQFRQTLDAINKNSPTVHDGVFERVAAQQARKSSRS